MRASLVTMADFTNGLRGQRNAVRDARRAGALGQLQKRQSAKDDPNLLDAGTQQAREFFLILRRDIDVQRWTTHTPSMGQNNST